MVEFLTHAGDKPVSGILMVTGEGKYKENAADENGVMQSNVERVAQVEVAFRWGTGYDRTIECFTNTIRNVHGGTHRKGFERALVRALTEAIRNARGLLKPKEDAPVLDDLMEGMTAVIHVRVPEPQFTSQTKDELSTAGITRVLQALVEAHIKEWVDGRRTKSEARTVLQKVVDAARVRLTQKQQKDAARRKTALEGASMPPKLVDCRSTGINRSELYIVEGDSALGTARMARSSEYQALLPIRGKILNVQKASLQQVLDNVECSAIVQVLGAGSGRTFDMGAMRYGRVMIMADADVDGSHIRTLLITLFAKYMRPVIEDGRLFAAMPPLHKVVTKGRSPETLLTYTQQELDSALAKLSKSGKSVGRVSRFKGLGEMDADELWDTTMNPATRTVRRITLTDVERAEETLELLMGERVEPRKNWLIEAASRIDQETIDA
jgi:DNA gyrase subunit B